MATATSSTRWVVGLVLVPLVLVAGFGGLVIWNGWSVLNSVGVFGDKKVPYDMPTQVARVAVPGKPSSLAWSADGKFLVAGAAGLASGQAEGGEIYVVDVAKSSVRVTLKVKSWVSGLAFSPDGKWLAVGGWPCTPASSTPAGSAPAELVVFDCSAFTPKFTATAGSRESSFIDLAWGADSKSLLAIDGPVNNAPGKAAIRRWNAPDFAEQPVVHNLQIQGTAALALSPDGRTLAFAEEQSQSDKLLVRLLDLNKASEDKQTEDRGTEQSSFSVGAHMRPARLGFTADGKAIGVFNTERLAWREIATGSAAKDGGKFAVQPAGLGDMRSHQSVTPDGRWVAQADDQHRGFGDLGFDNRGEEFGGFIRLTNSTTGKTQTWRAGKAQEAPVVAFSPDGTKLAGAVPHPTNASILIWAVPK